MRGWFFAYETRMHRAASSIMPRICSSSLPCSRQYETHTMDASIYCNEGEAMLQRMSACYNSRCQFNNDTICAVRKKHCAWKIREERTFDSYIDMKRESAWPKKLTDRNPKDGFLC